MLQMRRVTGITTFNFASFAIKHVQGLKFPLVRSYLRVVRGEGRVEILIRSSDRTSDFFLLSFRKLNITPSANATAGVMNCKKIVNKLEDC